MPPESQTASFISREAIFPKNVVEEKNTPQTKFKEIIQTTKIMQPLGDAGRVILDKSKNDSRRDPLSSCFPGIPVDALGPEDIQPRCAGLSLFHVVTHV